MLKKIPAMLLTAALLTGSVAATAAFAQTAPVQQQKIQVNLNEKELVFPQDVVTENGVAYVNASTLAIALGGTAAWDTMKESLLIAKDNTYALRMYKNSTFAYKNGKETRVPNPPRQTTGAVLVPLVYIAQELGAEVTYDENSRTYNLSIAVEK
ncbi:copper amine oxidase N-terminal domain-containing protein [Brevibacillus invocatus]|uniref:Copper amine oxidase N-terminal domain-containing protein n=1 Tax=Brevibacillus invocatus TaxID=173959 RepID=A0A3M8BVV6_9BACL|nr:copper amine oxidase N-terminal domain-containing protein [Brevibacillus invocatus]MCM3078485.1 copper amine oxidase N-terminal domain-containing protein [Brevibacillus invocatus]MCM3430937.1 copper amine oxidase N-terminal domain-containing protein [Brevibacillus invocatus]RNB67484.1 copper amine oxidase N-terminal domain-containing protein [Brevibacillus invocatus]